MSFLRSAGARKVFPYCLAALIFALDRLTKYLIQIQVAQSDFYTIIPGFFNIIHTENPGAAFSLFAGAQPEWRSFFLVGLNACALVLIVVVLWHPSGRIGDSRRMRLGLSLILGGALGNIYDRALVGTVTDFLDFYIKGWHWPAFNVADSAICIGAALMFYELLRTRRPAPKT